MGISLHVALLQTGRGCTEKEEEGEEMEEKHQHLESGYSSTESSSPHSGREEEEKNMKTEERGERQNEMCWDYLLSQVMGSCFHCMTNHSNIHCTVDLPLYLYSSCPPLSEFI